ncbi:hypothetical protein GCM10010106_34310 [Thermopolyspora flexuosa]|uniref:Uncharacterized protein n=1 Tax=Thermopolyspora flexuosa TaxID=103836 RepID=A0A543ITF5_9ACTN|nr:hypothetical protein [Thermopolyspora flexuosa]TQM73864.1 hypothetical protein FHX40_0519 [Thermopolyspora flexuosa]GGM84652.1 hypothetical protein GCM10010106_34310 [Thermopolyspora flexuosa]
MDGDGRLTSDLIRERLGREVLRSRRLAKALAEAHERVARDEEETAATYDALAELNPTRPDLREKARRAREAAGIARECARWAQGIARRAAQREEERGASA